MTLICLIGVVNSLLDGFTNEKIALGLRDKLWKKIYMPPGIMGGTAESLVSRITSDCNPRGRRLYDADRRCYP